MRTEDTSQYAWKRTLIFEPAKRVLWWHLPISSAMDYWFGDMSEFSVELVVKTPYETVSSLVSYSRSYELTDRLDKVIDQQASGDSIIE
jgi:hypothetical protein